MGKRNINDDNDPEYWNRMAKIIGNPVPEFEDDSDEVDENGVYRGKSLEVATKDLPCKVSNGICFHLIELAK